MQNNFLKKVFNISEKVKSIHFTFLFPNRNSLTFKFKKSNLSF